MSRHPRAVQEIMEGEVMVLIPGYAALRRLTDDCKFPEPKARRLLNIAWEFGQKAEPCPGGYVHVWYHGKDDTNTLLFSVVEHIGPSARKGVAQPTEKDYTQEETVPSRYGSGKAATRNRRKESAMPPKRTRAAAPEPEVAEANGDAVDFKKYLTKPISPTMSDFAEWMDQEVPGWDKVEVDRILVIGVTLYSHFQKSQFNIDRREARRAEREAAAPEPEPAAPARSGRGRSRTAPAPSKPAAAKSAPRASGRAKTRATAAAGDAPF
jgi:hypothetical protein